MEESRSRIITGKGNKKRKKNLERRKTEVRTKGALQT